jgi:hypothetical protein
MISMPDRVPYSHRLSRCSAPRDKGRLNDLINPAHLVRLCPTLLLACRSCGETTESSATSVATSTTSVSAFASLSKRSIARKENGSALTACPYWGLRVARSWPAVGTSTIGLERMLHPRAGSTTGRHGGSSSPLSLRSGRAIHTSTARSRYGPSGLRAEGKQARTSRGLGISPQDDAALLGSDLCNVLHADQEHLPAE